jgi:hypothetical protein
VERLPEPKAPRHEEPEALAYGPQTWSGAAIQTVAARGQNQNQKLLSHRNRNRGVSAMSHDTTMHDHHYQNERNLQPGADDRIVATEAVLKLLKDYARERPEVVALWAFGIGFVLGWKLKPW